MNPDVRLALTAIAAASLCLLPLACVRASRRRAPAVGWHLRPTHLLPASIQVCLFAYWSLYFRDLSGHFGFIAAQLALAYVLDALLGVIRKGSWRIGVGPVPMVLSLNLFVLYAHGQGYMALLGVTVAVCSKHLIQRGGRHIFNPSGLGVTVVGLLNIAMPALGDGDIAHEFNLPPNMAELIVLLALVVQSRVPVVLISTAAAIAMWAWTLAGGAGFEPHWAPVTLIIVLLATDPATSPRTGPGRVLYGLLFGVLTQAFASITPASPMFFFAKVLAIPLVNLAAPTCDALGARSLRARWLGEGRVAAALGPRRNRWHMAVWLALIGAALVVDKRPQIGPHHEGVGIHAYNRTPFVVVKPERRTDCADNPLHCGTATFAAELSCWLAAADEPAPGCGTGRAGPKVSTAGY